MRLNDLSDQRSVSYRLRSKRDHFLREFLLRNGRSILDIGGTSAYWKRVGLDFLKDNDFSVTLINLTPSQLGDGPFTCMVGDATAIDMADHSFDIVHSNSVIEHVGDRRQMAAFAHHASRLAPAYYVQTPNWWFPIDPHFYRVPGFHWLPRDLRIGLLQRLPIATAGRLHDRTVAAGVVDHTQLLSPKEMRRFFPGGELRFEQFGGLPKSIIVTRDA